MPFIARSRKAPTDLVGELLTEFARPLSYSFMADDDAAGGQRLLHHAQTEREAEIQPHGMADDLGREPIPAVAGASGGRHPTRLLTPACRRKRRKAAKSTVPNQRSSETRPVRESLIRRPGLWRPAFPSLRAHAESRAPRFLAIIQM